MSTVQPVRSPVSKFPLTTEEAATADLPLATRTSAIVAKAAAIANILKRGTITVERIGSLLVVRSAAPNRLLRSLVRGIARFISSLLVSWLWS